MKFKDTGLPNLEVFRKAFELGYEETTRSQTLKSVYIREDDIDKFYISHFLNVALILVEVEDQIPNECITAVLLAGKVHSVRRRDDMEALFSSEALRDLSAELSQMPNIVDTSLFQANDYIKTVSDLGEMVCKAIIINAVEETNDNICGKSDFKNAEHHVRDLQVIYQLFNREHRYLDKRQTQNGYRFDRLERFFNSRKPLKTDWPLLTLLHEKSDMSDKIINACNITKPPKL